MLISENKGRWTTYGINVLYEVQPIQLGLGDIEDKSANLKESHKKIYEYIITNGFITSKEVTNITTIHSISGACKALNKLIADGLILRKKQGRHIIYILK